MSNDEQGNDTPENEGTTIPSKVKKEISDTVVDLNSRKAAKTGVSMQLPPIEHNIPQLQEFLDVVFGGLTDPRKDEHILTWIGGIGSASKGYPLDSKKLLKALDRSRKPKTLYYSTGVSGTDVSPHTGEPMLRNTRDAFKFMPVVVLDDIGTKVPESNIPLEPSYIIESSEGNYQYGYLLEEPIEVYEHASALVKALYYGGYSDAGGAMPTKLVRLPDGYNGKTNPEKGGFRVRLNKLDGDIVYTVQEMIEGFSLDLDWEEVKDSKHAPIYSKHGKIGNTGGMRLPEYEADGGLNDPLLEVLIEQKLAHNISSHEWFTITCPWHDEHTNTGEYGWETAGYSPIGRGAKDYQNSRGFKCFHEHCKDRTTTDFLEWVYETTNKQFYTTEPATKFLQSLMYAPAEHAAYIIGGCEDGFQKGIEGVKLNRDVRQALFPDSVPKFKTMAAVAKELNLNRPSQLMVDHWLNSPHKIILNGHIKDPRLPNNMLVQKDDKLLLNRRPSPAKHEKPADYSPDNKYITALLDYIDYLVPNENIQDKLIGMLAAKCADITFRGLGMVMFTPTQGIGRSTLFAIIRDLISGGVDDISVNIEYEELVGESSSYNSHFINAAVVTVEELPDAETSTSRERKKHYNSLKALVSPDVKETTLKEKYQPDSTAVLHSMLFVASQHIGALPLPEDDRRFIICRNPSVPRSAEYYANIRELFHNSKIDEWRPYVYQWFLDHHEEMSDEEISGLVYMHDEAAITLKQSAREASLNSVDKIVSAMREALFKHGVYALPKKIINGILEDQMVTNDAVIDKVSREAMNKAQSLLFSVHSQSAPKKISKKTPEDISARYRLPRQSARPELTVWAMRVLTGLKEGREGELIDSFATAGTWTDEHQDMLHASYERFCDNEAEIIAYLSEKLVDDL